jgi:uncharacterized protein
VSDVTLITGASSGIGEELAYVAAAAGRRLVLTARSAEGLSRVADAVAAKGFPKPDVIPLDLSLPEAADKIEDWMKAKNLRIAELVNNAGYGISGPLENADRMGQIGMVDLNIRALTDLTIRFLPEIIEAKGGILNVGSVASYVPGPGMTIYYASKAYVLSFSEALSVELKGRVRVTALCPGPTPTGFQERARPGSKGRMFPFLPHTTAKQVAREGWQGFERGKRVVIPGWLNKTIAFLGPRLPRALILAASDFRSRKQRQLAP